MKSSGPHHAEENSNVNFVFLASFFKFQISGYCINNLWWRLFSRQFKSEDQSHTYRSFDRSRWKSAFSSKTGNLALHGYQTILTIGCFLSYDYFLNYGEIGGISNDFNPESHLELFFLKYFRICIY